MPFSHAETSQRDIIDAIEIIERFTVGMDLQTFREDPKTVSAVEPKLQIVSEAAIRLGSEAEDRLPDLPRQIFEAWATGCTTNMTAWIWKPSGMSAWRAEPADNSMTYVVQLLCIMRVSA